MSFEIIFLFALLAVTIILFVSEKMRLDIVALLVICALMVSEILTPREALAGFGDPVVFLIAALFVIGEALYRTGLAAMTGNWMMRVAGEGETRLILLLMSVVAVLSAFMSSTGAVAIFIPIAMTLATKTGTDPKKLLMPMAIASLIGGMLTLIGTPPNIVVSTQLERAGLEPFGFFDFTPAGLVVLVVGILYMLLIGRRLIAPSEAKLLESNEKSLIELAESFQLQGQLHKLNIHSGSDLVGVTLVESKLRRKYGLIVIAITRKHRVGEKIIPVFSDTIFKPNDTLYLVNENAESDLTSLPYSVSVVGVNDPKRESIIQVIGLAEVMIAPESKLIGESIKSFNFRDKHNLSVISVLNNHKEYIRQPLDQTLSAGDRLLVAGSWPHINGLTAQSSELIMMTLPQEHKRAVPESDKAHIAIGILGLMLGALTFKWVPTETAVLLAALAFGATGCINMTQAYKSISWQSLVLIAGMLPMATALQKTGAMELVINNLVGALGDSGPLMIMATLFIITTVFSQFISNTATAVLIAPIATGIAESMGISPYPLVMMVAIAASTAFSTPVASPVNALILGPGGYKFGEFAKVGVPLQVIIMLVSLVVLPMLFPF